MVSAVSTSDRQHVDCYRRKNTLMLATLMASAAYAVGFNPPGGVWQDMAGHLPGDPIMRSTHYRRYLVFFYFNAAAFTLSLMVIVLTLILNARLKKSGRRFDLPLQLLMGTAALAFIAAYGTGACWDKFRVVAFFVFLAILVLNIMLQSLLFWLWGDDEEDEIEKNLGKLMAPLSMFALTISYVGGLSTPGGFWDSAEGGHRPGDAILRSKLLHLFFYFNTGQFASSLFGVFLVMCSGLQVKFVAFFMKVWLLGLIVAYTVGSSRGRHTSVTVICSLFAAVGAYVILYVAIRGCFSGLFEKLRGRFSCLFEKAQDNEGTGGTSANDGTAGSRDDLKAVAERQRRRASSLVQLLAGLAVSVTYQAGMYPPGGVWQDGHKAGDPILLTTNPTRYKAFFYCNSVAFVASLLAILLGQKSYLSEHHALQATMILDLLSLVVAYAIGSCRDQISSMYAVGIAGAAVVYVVVHIQYFTLGLGNADKDDDDAATSAMVDKKGGRFILFAILVASITYQAGLTPPGGFLLQDDSRCGHHAGDPVLLCNNPRRYKVFFYFNSVSFMISTVLLLLLVNPNLYRPAIRSHALSLCSGVSFVCLVGAFAAGSTQYLKTSISIVVLAAAAFLLCLPILLTVYCCLPSRTRLVTDNAVKKAGKPGDNKPVYLMTLAILVGSATYQAGLDPPGGSWQSTGDGHDAGHPAMHDNRRNRYLTFLYGNTTSFVASIYLIELLLFSRSFPKCIWLKKAIEPTVVAQYVGFLVAYAAGSSRHWKTSAHIGTLVAAVLAYVTAHVLLSDYRRKSRRKSSENSLQR
ncbi:uncharacterized protein LOC124648869 [Lolium rigidum]|uniref:uncharacterized protein LOC124648869 n=1 Tax=Lolium rigidum TaxID=89674 RepID=UPI001F5C8FE5|nr:uncharacterized protein LOC124648869 [Lolium rigidum]